MLTYLRDLGLGRSLTFYEGDAGGGGGSGGSSGDGGAGAGAGGQGAAGAGGSGDGGQGAGDGTISPAVQAQLDQLQQAVAATNAENRRLKAAADKAAADAAAAAGNYEELYKQEQQKREELEKSVASERRGSTVQRVAERLEFKSPSIAVRLIDGLDDIDPGDEREMEKRLKKIATDHPELLAAPQTRQLAGAGGRQQGAGSGNDQMNAAIRAAAGRGA